MLLSIDVEEEGLFRGTYATRNAPTLNMRSLKALLPFLERGITPTLFCSYAALTSDMGKKVLTELMKKVGVEIGAHLHWWNTPPCGSDRTSFLTSVPSINLPLETFEEKLKTLLECIKMHYGHQPVSFRMGRWDLHKPHFEILARNGIKQDASVRPLHGSRRLAPDHYAAPANPYLIKTASGVIYEFPLTVTPIFKWLRKAVRNSFFDFSASFPKWGSLTLLPVEHPLPILKLTTELFYRRGGKAISLTWHSSEMMPGGNPKMPTREKCEGFLKKMHSYLDWLESGFDVTYTTLAKAPSRILPVKVSETGSGDWRA